MNPLLGLVVGRPQPEPAACGMCPCCHDMRGDARSALIEAEKLRELLIRKDAILDGLRRDVADYERRLMRGPKWETT